MSINIVIHTPLIVTELQPLLAGFVHDFEVLFENEFIVNKAHESNAINKEIAVEFNFHSNSFFRVTLNEKLSADKIKDVCEFFNFNFKSLGIKILPLFENESLIG